MRFEGRFSSRLVAAFGPLVDSRDAAVALRAARDQLGFLSAALDIAVGPAPEVDLLDMMTLVTMGREAMARRWDAVAGDDGRRVSIAFQMSLDDISAIARRVISPAVAAEVEQVMREWLETHPDHEDVTSVRLSVYAKYREGSAGDRGGLVALLRGAAQTADTAVLLGERVLYATQRLPNLVRLHARIGGTELLGDFGRNVRALATPRSARRLFWGAAISLGGVAAASALAWTFARAIRARW
jgi:hypothetical protein